MFRYRVRMECTAVVEMLVEADTEEEAYDKAFDSVFESVDNSLGIQYFRLDCLQHEVKENNNA